MANMYDIVIVGGGPGGYSAALYAARAGLHVVVLEKQRIGGQAVHSENIENYPGFDAGIDGLSLSEKMQRGAERFGAEMVTDEVRRVQLMQPVKVVETTKQTYQAPAVILATGAPPKKLGVQGEAEMLGRGVHYYAACRSMMYKRRTVAVIGAGEQAAEAAMLLSRIAKRVCLVHQGKQMQIDPVYMSKLKMMGNIERYAGSSVLAFLHANWVSSIRIREERDGEIWNLPCDGAFVCLGGVPETGLFQGQAALDEQGYILANETTATNLPGVFAVGDVRTKLLRGILTAAADGAVAAQQAERYIVGAVGFELGDIIVHPGDQRIIVFVGNRLIVHIASRQLLGKNFIEDRVFVICNRLVDAAVGKCARRNILSVPPFDERRHAVFPAEGEKLGFHLIVVGETVVAAR